jgi:hypothetical protein
MPTKEQQGCDQEMDGHVSILVHKQGYVSKQFKRLEKRDIGNQDKCAEDYKGIPFVEGVYFLLELFKLPDKKKNNKNKERIKKHECILKQFNQWVLSQSEQKPNASNRDKKRNQLDWLVPDENIVLQVEQDQYNPKHKHDFSQKSISHPFVEIRIQCVNKYKNIEVNPRELF